MNILAIGAHPDDNEMFCAGTLALYSKLGHKVYMYHATDGDKGGMGNRTCEEIRKERRESSINAAKIINAVSLGGDFDDGEIVVDLKSRLIITDVIRKCNPDVIFTHYPLDYHTDHINISKLVFEASFMASIQKLKTKYKALNKFPILYYFDTVCGIDFIPKDYVDISKVMSLKLKMYSLHKSTLNFNKELHDGIDLMDMVEVTSKYRGYQCNTKYAEGFIQKIVWSVGSTKRILP